MSRRRKQKVAFSLFAFQDIITSVVGIMILVTLILALEMVQQMEASPLQRTKAVVGEIDSANTNVDDLKAAVERNLALIASLQDRLVQGAFRIDEVAEFDQRRTAEEIENLNALDVKLGQDLAELAKQLQRSNDQRSEIEAERDSLDPDDLMAKLEKLEELKEELEKLKTTKRIIFNPTEGDSKTPWLVEITAATITAAKVGVSAPPTVFSSPSEFRAWARKRDKQSEYFVLLIKPDGIESFEEVHEALRKTGFDVGYDLLNTDQVAIDPEKGAAAR